MAIHGLSMLWKNCELVTVKPISGAITSNSGIAIAEMSIRALSLVKKLDMKAGKHIDVTVPKMPTATHIFIVSM